MGVCPCGDRRDVWQEDSYEVMGTELERRPKDVADGWVNVEVEGVARRRG